MKKLLYTCLFMMLAWGAVAQVQDPVEWNYSARKKSADTYEVVITATLDKPWHIYSQNTPKGGPRPTIISFKKNPLVEMVGKAKENGKLEVVHDKLFGVDVKYYSNRVEFIQTVKLKGNVKTNVAGTVEYMVCDEEQCLPPTKKTFDIKLQ